MSLRANGSGVTNRTDPVVLLHLLKASSQSLWFWHVHSTESKSLAEADKGELRGHHSASLSTVTFARTRRAQREEHEAKLESATVLLSCR